ncbi:MAG: trypsin-like peptidase domain-containing protein [Myxococcota bacterium]
MVWFVLALAHAADRRTPVVEAVEIATPSVVALQVDVPTQSPFSVFGGPTIASSQGSGVVIDDDGIVLTNAHVVQGATRIQAHTIGGEVYEARPIALDAELDLAVLRLEDAKGLVAIEVANSDEILLGETVIAIGNPYGLGLTVSTGVVASKERQVEIQPGLYQSYIQTDAAINPGNSGGALVDVEGRLIGVNTAIRAEAEGIGFAIPANRARKIADDLLLYGSVRAPWLGCDFTDISARKLAGTGLSGALRVAAVFPESPCAAAGMEIGDVVYQIDGRPTSSRADLNAWLAQKKPGDTVVLEAVHRDAIVARELASSDLPKNAARRALERLGIVVAGLDGRGLAVTEVNPEGTWAQNRLRVGDIIVAVDGARTNRPEDLVKSLQQAKARHQPAALFTVRRGRIQGHVPVEI